MVVCLLGLKGDKLDTSEEVDTMRFEAARRDQTAGP